MHASPYSDVFNNNVAKAFQYYTHQYPNLQFCTIAHNHKLSANDIYEDGIIYYGSTCMKHRCYLIFTITPEGFDYEVVYY